MSYTIRKSFRNLAFYGQLNNYMFYRILVLDKEPS